MSAPCQNSHQLDPFPVPLLNLGAADSQKTRQQLIAELDVVRATPDVYAINMQQTKNMLEEHERLKKRYAELKKKAQSLKKQLLEFPEKMVRHADVTARTFAHATPASPQGELENANRRLQQQYEHIQLQLRGQNDQIRSLQRHLQEQEQMFASAKDTIDGLRTENMVCVANHRTLPPCSVMYTHIATFTYRS